MKTQIIRLNPHDDTISLRDKMGWSQTSRILLVWPDHQRILNRRLDLVLLQRHAASLGAQLALVVHNEEVRSDAALLGIPVFETPKEAQASRWRVSRRRRLRLRRDEPPPDLVAIREIARPKPLTWLAHPVIRIVSFTLAVLALLALAAFLLPAARLTLSPSTQEQQVTLPVTASPATLVVNLVGEVPAQPVSEIVEGRDSLTATGSVQAPVSAAQGSIKFTNLTEETVDVPEGTIVSTWGANPIRFVTTRHGQVPAGAGRSITVPITALVPGASGNLPADSLVALQGEQGLSLSATNPQATHDGADGTTTGPSTADRKALYDQLVASLRQTALTDLQAKLPQGDLSLAPTLEVVHTLEETYTPAEGQPGEQLELTLRLEFQALVVSGRDLHALAIPVLDASLPEGFSPLPDTLTVTTLTQPKLNADGSVSWTISAQRTLRAEIPEAQAIQLVVGLPLTQASQRLSNELPLADSPKISLNPTWWPRLPFLSFRIQVTSQSMP
jgi:hypothetical protein